MHSAPLRKKLILTASFCQRHEATGRGLQGRLERPKKTTQMAAYGGRTLFVLYAKKSYNSIRSKKDLGGRHDE
jgi:hypothetical protein